MSGTVLTRVSFPTLSFHASGHPLAHQVDEGVSRFLEEATDPKVLTSIVAGGLAYRWGRAGAMAFRLGAYGNTPLRAASIAVGLGSEVTAFEFTKRSWVSLSLEGEGRGEGDSGTNLWNWSGPGGWKEGLASSAITFGMLKGAGFLTREENLVLQHVFQSSAMVAGHQTAGFLNILPRPSQSIAEQFLFAEATNLQLGAGLSLTHALAPRLHAFERGLDLITPTPSPGTDWNIPFPSLAGVGLGRSKAGFTEAFLEKRFPTAPLLMSTEGEGKGNPRIYDTLPPPPEDAQPWKDRTFKTLALKLDVEIPPEEMEGTISEATQKRYRARVMDLIAKPAISQVMDPEHLRDLRIFVIGGWGQDAKIFVPLYQLFKQAREMGLVENKTILQRVPLPLDSPSERLAPQEYFLGAAPHAPRSPRHVEARFRLLGLGEVAAFTAPAGKPGRNDGAFGMNGKGVFIVAEGLSEANKGDLASALAVETVVKGVTGTQDSLGKAFLEVHQGILKKGLDGETVASAVRIHPDGKVEATVAGNVEIWVFLRQDDGSYELFPYATSEGNRHPVRLGYSGEPQLVDKLPPVGHNEISHSFIFLPQTEGDLNEEPLRLKPGDGLLLMSNGLSRYYQNFPGQLTEIMKGRESASDILEALQKDAADRAEVFEWRQQYKVERRSHPRQGFKIPEGYKMAGQYITLGGMVFDSPKQEKWTGLFNSEDNQTALVYVHRILEGTSPRSEGKAPESSSSPADQVGLEALVESVDWPPPTENSKVVINFPIDTLELFIEKFAHHLIPGGIFIKSQSTLPMGSIFDFEFRLKNGQKILKGSGQVEQVRRQEGSSEKLPPGMGIKFLDLDEESQFILKRLLNSRK